MGLQDDVNKAEADAAAVQAKVDPFYVKAVKWVKAHAPQVVIGAAVIVVLVLLKKVF